MFPPLCGRHTGLTDHRLKERDLSDVLAGELPATAKKTVPIKIKIKIRDSGLKYCRQLGDRPTMCAHALLVTAWVILQFYESLWSGGQQVQSHMTYFSSGCRLPQSLPGTGLQGSVGIQLCPRAAAWRVENLGQGHHGLVYSLSLHKRL